MRRLAIFVILASLVGASSVAAASSRTVSSPIDGRWLWTWTRTGLIRNGASLAEVNGSPQTLINHGFSSFQGSALVAGSLVKAVPALASHLCAPSLA
jgi:hypothetical protein